MAGKPASFARTSSGTAESTLMKEKATSPAPLRPLRHSGMLMLCSPRRVPNRPITPGTSRFRVTRIQPKGRTSHGEGLYPHDARLGVGKSAPAINRVSLLVVNRQMMLFA